MAGAASTSRRLLRALPLLAVWALAAWPVALWLVHRSDPETAVQLAQTAAAVLQHTGFWLLVFGGGACLLLPAARAGVRLVGHRTWRRLATDHAPLQRALANLDQFASPARHLDVARLAFQRGLTELASTHAVKAVEGDGGTASAWHLLGTIAFAQRQYPVAAAALARAEGLDPGHAFGDALLLGARARQLLGDPAALALLEEHARRHGGGPKSHLWLAEALQQAGQTAAATAALRTAAQRPTQAQNAEDGWYRAVASMRLWGRKA
jgi:tetratricopeptide (TPR) repeat protein